MRVYNIRIKGTQPLLMHHDDIDWADAMERWRGDKDNKKKSKAGDDRTPAYRWLGCLYIADGVIGLPMENLMRALMEGAALVPVPGAKGSKTFKSQSQSGLMPRAICWPLLVTGKTVQYASLAPLRKEPDFAVHRERVQQHGFSLFLKRARIGQSKHVRVRPRFDDWSASGQLTVTDDQITEDVLRDIFEMAGTYKGLGDWRPGAKTPGSYGMFEATVASA
jgi:hypothetical protein